MVGKMLMAIAWPAFLAACLMEAAVFAVVDPLDVAWAAGSLGWSRQGTYALAFFMFWLVTLGACGLTMLLRPRSQRGAESP